MQHTDPARDRFDAMARHMTRADAWLRARMETEPNETGRALLGIAGLLDRLAADHGRARRTPHAGIPLGGIWLTVRSAEHGTTTRSDAP